MAAATCNQTCRYCDIGLPGNSEQLALLWQSAVSLLAAVGQSGGEPQAKFPELKFKYVEEEQPEEFFIPYVWSLVYNSAVGLYWNPQDVQLFTMDSD
ncbi:Dymeclin [Sciurus carolinensis]|uniref:Dymeclin n=1 Tax=Sciurus carolinensis TaxID=30640 RepID=A0AA41MCA6_SCICA|nr:Dymeclin [Sciurus carolinensis]